MTKIGLFIGVMIAVLIGYNIQNEYFPDGLAQPTLMKTYIYSERLLNNVLVFLDRCRLVDLLQAKRAIFDFLLNPVRQVSGIQIADTTIDGVPVRTYYPKEHYKTNPLPCMIYYHGGGWTILSPDAYDPVTTHFSKDVWMVVVSVRYRLNPEYSQKDGLDDCVRVTKTVIQMPSKYGIDPERVVIAGDSAGGNYAAAVSLVLRDEQFAPMPKLQLLIYPVVQMIDLQLPSYQQNADGPLLTSDMMCWFFSQVHAKNDDYIPYFRNNTHVPGSIRRHYAKDLLNHAKDAIPRENRYPPYVPPDYDSGDSEIWDAIKDQVLDPYHYPLMADDHRGLPEAYIFTGKYDILRDEGYLYAGLLRDAGVSVTHYNSPVGWHGMINFFRQNDDSVIVMNAICSFLREKLA